MDTENLEMVERRESIKVLNNIIMYQGVPCSRWHLFVCQMNPKVTCRNCCDTQSITQITVQVRALDIGIDKASASSANRDPKSILHVSNVESVI